MKPRAFWVCGMLLVMIVWVCTSVVGAAAEAPPGTIALAEVPSVPAAPLSSVNLAADYGPGFEYLSDLGRQIDAARAHPSANSLANCALEILYAEKASGQTSKAITGRQLLEEATAMARQAQSKKALQRLADLWRDPVIGAGDPTQAQQVADWAAAISHSISVSATTFDITFVNQTNYTVDCWVNGVMVQTLDPLGGPKSKWTDVDVPAGNTTIYATASNGHHWGSQEQTVWFDGYTPETVILGPPAPGTGAR